MKKWIVRKLGVYLKQQVLDIAVYLWLEWSEDRPSSVSQVFVDGEKAIKYVSKHGRPALPSGETRSG